MSLKSIKRGLLKAYLKAASLMRDEREACGLHDIRKILVINTTAIGDTLICTPAIRALKEAFPDASITALVGVAAREVLENNPHIDELISHSGRMNLAYFIKLPGLIRRLKRGRFDLAAVLYGNDPDAVPIAYLSGAPIRLGTVRTEFSNLLTHYRPSSAKGHIIKEKLKALEAIGIESLDTRMDFFLTDAEEREAERFLEGAGDIVSIHPFGSKRNKQWPEDYCVKLADALFDRFSLKVVLIGGPKEAEAIGRIATDMKSEPLCTGGRLGLRIASAVIKKSKMVITTDSGPLHIAQAFRVPTIALIGSTNWRTTGPLEDNAVVLERPSACGSRRPCKFYDCEHISCVMAVTPDLVIDTVERILSKESEPFQGNRI